MQSKARGDYPGVARQSERLTFDENHRRAMSHLRTGSRANGIQAVGSRPQNKAKPTRHYGANNAWQQLSILAHNVARSFQLDTFAEPKPRSRKRTYAYVLRSMRTLRFLLIARAGRLTRIDGRNVLRLAANPATEQLYAKVAHALAA